MEQTSKKTNITVASIRADYSVKFKKLHEEYRSAYKELVTERDDLIAQLKAKSNAKIQEVKSIQKYNDIFYDSDLRNVKDIFEALVKCGFGPISLAIIKEEKWPFTFDQSDSKANPIGFILNASDDEILRVPTIGRKKFLAIKVLRSHLFRLNSASGV